MISIAAAVAVESLAARTKARLPWAAAALAVLEALVVPAVLHQALVAGEEVQVL